MKSGVLNCEAYILRKLRPCFLKLKRFERPEYKTFCSKALPIVALHLEGQLEKDSIACETSRVLFFFPYEQGGLWGGFLVPRGSKNALGVFASPIFCFLIILYLFFILKTKCKSFFPNKKGVIGLPIIGR